MTTLEPPGEQPASPGTAPGDESPPETPGAGEEVCPVCGGSGLLDGAECPECEGTGRVAGDVGGA